MKKLLIIPLMFIYLFAASGVMIYAHYCGKELSSWNVYTQNEGCADKDCGDKSGKPDDCCKDKLIVAKIANEQNAVPFFNLKTSFGEWVPLTIPYAHEDVLAKSVSVKITGNYANAPPGRWQQIPLFKLHSSFTYYG
jgi:hypothetical protein